MNVKIDTPRGTLFVDSASRTARDIARRQKEDPSFVPNKRMRKRLNEELAYLDAGRLSSEVPRSELRPQTVGLTSRSARASFETEPVYPGDVAGLFGGRAAELRRRDSETYAQYLKQFGPQAADAYASFGRKYWSEGNGATRRLFWREESGQVNWLSQPGPRTPL